MIRTYSEMMRLPTFEERFKYLKLDGMVSELTFGHNRYLNQEFYSSEEWKRFRRRIIIRDEGCDLACLDRKILSKIIIHHLNPITVDDILERRPCVLDDENAVCVTHKTHNAIHYGDSSLIPGAVVTREKDDTILWR